MGCLIVCLGNNQCKEVPHRASKPWEVLAATVVLVRIWVAFDTHTFRFFKHIGVKLIWLVWSCYTLYAVHAFSAQSTLFGRCRLSWGWGSRRKNKTVCGKKTKGKKGISARLFKKKILPILSSPYTATPLLASLTLSSSLFLTLNFHSFSLSKPHTFFFLHKLAHPSSPAFPLHDRLDQNSQLAFALHCRPIKKYLSPKNLLPKNLSRKYSIPQSNLHLYFSLEGLPLVLITWKFRWPSLLCSLVSLMSKIPPIFFEIWNKGKSLILKHQP